MDLLSKRDAITLTSPLPLSECRRFLSLSMDGFMDLFGNRPVIGSIRKTRLRARKRISYRNSFQTVLTARLLEQNGQTRIFCTFSLATHVIVFMYIWFGMVTLGAIIAIASSWKLFLKSSFQYNELAGALSPIALLAFGVALVTIGKKFSRNEQNYLIDFVCQTVNAQPDQRDSE